MSHLTIDVTTMGFRVGVNSIGDLKGTKLSIVPFSKQFQNKQYDRVDGVWYVVNEFFYFDSENEVVYFPKFSLDEFKTFLNMNGVTYSIKEIPSVEGKDESFLMLPFVEYKNDKQKNAVEFLTNENTGPLRGLALQTGAGKTVSFIMALQKLGKRAVVTMTSRLEQWVKELIKYTTLEENDIYVIQGLGSLTKLFKQIDDGVKPKIILASTATMRLYIEYRPSYQHLPHPSEMCEKLGVGIIGTDEYHEHFHTNFLIGLMFNPKVFIPITATFSASDPFVKNIFDKFIPNDLQFVGGDYDRFVNVTSYTYRGGGHLIKPYQYTSRQGYSQQMFEKFLMSKKGKFVLDPLVQDAILPIIREHYINLAEDGEKLLVLCSSTNLCDHLASVFKRAFNNKTVSVFYSGMPTTVLEKFDIIISTPGSAGCLTGDTIVSISRNKTDSQSGSYECTLKNAFTHFNGLAKRPQYNWDREVPTYTRSYNGKTIQLGEIGDIIYSGVKSVYRVTLANGLSIKCTCDHLLMTTNGWVQAKDVVGSQVMCELKGVPDYSEAISFEYVGEEDTYDIHCLDQNHNFVANGIVVHNTGRDIKNLRTCFVFENTNSEIRNLQFIGRLRPYPAVKNTPEFAYLSMGCIPQHQKYHNARSLLFGSRALSIKHRSIS